jgi:hypothetical protein
MPRARGRSRQAGSEQVATTRAAALGFDDVRGYLADRYTRKAWTISEIAVELGVGEKVAKRLRRALRPWGDAGPGNTTGRGLSTAGSRSPGGVGRRSAPSTGGSERFYGDSG